MLKYNRIIFLIFLFSQTSFSSIAQKSSDGDKKKTAVVNMGHSINSKFSDYAPVVSADGSVLVFTSRRPQSEKEIRDQKESNEAIYISYFDFKKKRWGAAVKMGATLNLPNRHNSAIALSNDGQILLLYRDDEKGNGDIYESELKGNTWSEPVKLPPPVNTTFHESSASLSPDGREIYFISNREGGIGGRDIWVCKKNAAGNWGEAQILGPIINSEKDEEGIFIHPDGKTIFFSSKGQDGLGGYDIFRSEFQDGHWSAPINLGMPLNSKDDDLCFVLLANGKTGYFSSAREGSLGDKDIYEINFSSPIVKNDSGPELTLLKGSVKDELNGEPVAATIEIIDNDKNVVVAIVPTNSKTGNYLVSLPSGKNYAIEVKSKNYLFHSENINVPATSGFREINLDIPLKQVVVGKSIVLRNIFYDFDKATLRNESIAELEQLIQLLNDNPKLTIELSSHTDSRGSDEYNIDLSQRRAQSVVDFLLNNGVSAKRLFAKGYGESKPISTNETEEGMQQNRRTEFKILSN